MLKTYPKICASVAGNPSALGVRMHNEGYHASGLEYTYIAMGTSNIEGAISAVKLLGYRGLGVSMPFKQEVIKYLDSVDDSVTTIGACNTVVNDDGKLIGYNTDWIGAQDAIKEVADFSNIRSAVIVGAGGVARSIAYALKHNGVEVYISARNELERKKLVSELSLAGETDIAGQGEFEVDLVVNATPDSTTAGPVDLSKHNHASVLLDVVFTSYMTDLTRSAVERNIKYASGWRMLLFQGAKQFELYTGVKAPVDAMGNVLKDWLNAK